MKLLLTFAAFLFFSFQLSAQHRLSKSRESGYFTYIYKITDKETAAIAAKGADGFNENFLHSLIDSFYTAKSYKKQLPFGNYIYLNTYRNKLKYRLKTVSNAELHFVNNLKEFQFYLTDQKGNYISNARVETGKGKRINFDQAAQLYKAPFPKEEDFIKVEYEGISNYFTFELDNDRYNYRDNWSFFKKVAYTPPIKYTWQPLKKLFSKKYKTSRKPSDYTGFMVFSKPKYKPLDTVKFKAYVLTRDGKKISDKEVTVSIVVDGKNKVLGNIKPYHDGGYAYSFVLADSLNLKLDRNYTINLTAKHKKEDESLITQRFYYEDYELKSLSFAVRTDRDKHQIGAPVSVFMKATDENELAVPDGRVEITALTNHVKQFGNAKVFVPDTLWKKSLTLDPVGETKLVLPDSIFPKADFDFSVRFDFRNSNNESRSFTKFLSYSFKRDEKPLAEITSSLKKDSLFIDYRLNDKSEKRNATVVSYSINDVVLDSVQVELPKLIKIDYRAENYKVTADDGLKEYIFLSDFSPELRIGAVQGKDSLHVVVNNVNKVPFWYTIFSGNKVLLKGFSNELDTLIRHKGSKAAHIRINYYWDDKEVNQEVSAFYNPNLLNVKLIAPDMVYPGQKVNMLIKVTDVADKPVANTDLTAYSFTSKFKNEYLSSLPDFSRKFYARKKKDIKFEADELSLESQKDIDWVKWGKRLGLDTIEYYKFTHPQNIYTIQEAVNDTTAQIAPFVISKGALVPVNIVFMDGVPVFFSQADQLSRYSFVAKPGNHFIGLRTANKDISIYNVELVKGKKTIISINADSGNEATYGKITADLKNAPDELTFEESQRINQYMFKVHDNFDGDKAIVSAGGTDLLLNPPPNVSTGKDLLIGPVKENYLIFKKEGLNQDFIRETGYTYTFTPGLIKQKSYNDKLAFNPKLLFGNNGGNTNYTEYALRSNEIDSLWDDYLNLRSYTTQLFTNPNQGLFNTGRLDYKIDTAFTKKLPYIKNIIIYKPDEPDFVQIYAGNTTYLPSFTAGVYKMMFLLKDNRYFIAQQINIKAKGVNHYEWGNFKISPADNFSIGLDHYIKGIKRNNQYYPTETVDREVIENFNKQNFETASLKNTMSGRVISASDKQALPGVSVKVVGLSSGVSTDKDGKFWIKVPSKGKISVSYLGFETLTREVKNGDVGDIGLKEDTKALQEVVVVGYGSVQKKSLTGSVITITPNQLMGRAAGLNVTNNDMIRLRGVSSIANGEKPMVIVDGVPFTGDINSLSPDDITNMDVLKSADATAIYGSRAANGVIIIKTKNGNVSTNAAGELIAQQQTMRTNFSDEGFWQPQLITDETGTARFSVKFPDDITNWKTRVIVINSNKQTGFTETFIKSFKSLSANFVSPLFAVKGDSINVIGKLMNYTPLVEQVTRKFVYNGLEMRNSAVKIKNSHIDTLAIAVTGKDSLNFEYTLKQDNGYFDGEIRKIPVYEAGVLETKGYFSAMLRDTSITYNFDKNLGKVTVRAESSIFPTLLDEMTKLRNYEYLCNEQLASKLKSLLLEKKVRKYLDQPFIHEKDIAFILKKLQQTRKPQGTWGWWESGDEQIWISLHVVEALLQAEKQGYKVELKKQVLYNYLVDKLANESGYDQLQVIKLLHLLDDKYFIKDWVVAFEKKKTTLKPDLYDRLALMELKQMAGIKVNIDSLLSLKKETMFGNIYWGNGGIRFWDNSIQNTLLAYKLLKNAGGHEHELEKIALYFLEQRKDGQWRNTFESSLILETILPEMLGADQKAEPASISLNEANVTKFPYSEVLNDVQSIKLTKKGKMPVYFTAFQQFQNPKPEKVSKDFTVNSSFIQNGSAVKKLKGGKLTTLKVEVDVRADADYVMIEIPIPAGCSYENKPQSFWGAETHREYFKNKTSIFCTKLKQGKYTFNIDLMPRYSGSYVLNPAKAEMMYFPVFYGREGMKKVAVN
ncbi:carboxypeptidase-like regulatory domain-containing protein [Pedobacter sp. UBA5917]|jgi:TonB-dependent SusC/RagA subfamily outer membrane receptor|uniref:carboxypeptidase-like regulatory domain-containing protein n=1 Tax=Pedobacter sp. UBA5917 TaxID=1947061 RepID=UPI0025F7C313|nr:carboxypeptidase-like regulatory domain-containing protein [Pedobacter sp. UBA5917]